MQAILAREFGGPDVLKLEDVPDPAAGPGQVRVKVHAVGVNPYDTYMRTGTYAIKPELPYTPGADAAGVVDQVGAGVSGIAAGDRVYISGTATGKAHGAYAQLVVCEPQPGSPSAGPRLVRAGRRPVRALRHRVARAVRPRQHARRRRRADPRRERRCRRGRDAVRPRGGRDGDRHGRHRRRAGGGEGARRAARRESPRRRLPRGDRGAHRRTRARRHPRDARQREPRSRPDHGRARRAHRRRRQPRPRRDRRAEDHDQGRLGVRARALGHRRRRCAPRARGDHRRPGVRRAESGGGNGNAAEGRGTRAPAR